MCIYGGVSSLPCSVARRRGRSLRARSSRQCRWSGFSGVPRPRVPSSWSIALLKGLDEAGFIDARNLAIEYPGPKSKRSIVGAGGRISRPARDRHREPRPQRDIGCKGGDYDDPCCLRGRNDPVATGLVASLNRPGGNLTGATYLSAELGAERLGLIHEKCPGSASPCSHILPVPQSVAFIDRLEDGRPHLGLQLQVLNA